MDWLIGFGLGALVGAAAGFWLGRRAGGGADSVQLATRLEERDRRLEELQSDLRDSGAAQVEAVEQSARLQAELARRNAEMEALRTHTEEKVAELKSAREQLEQSFKALANDVLKSNSQSFMDLARSQMETLLKQADGTFEKRREAIEKALHPVSETLKRYEENLKLIEQHRTSAYGELRAQVETLTKQHSALKDETGHLANALRNPQIQGRWGELTLRRTAELSGMAEYCDFTEQVSVEREGARQRPDMIIHLPSDRVIVVDSKAPLNAYGDAVNATNDQERALAMKTHAQKVREHVRALARPQLRQPVRACAGVHRPVPARRELLRRRREGRSRTVGGRHEARRYSRHPDHPYGASPRRGPRLARGAARGQCPQDQRSGPRVL